jgi:hypothetical protein
VASGHSIGSRTCRGDLVCALAADQGLPPTAALFAYGSSQVGCLLKKVKTHAPFTPPTAAFLSLRAVRKGPYIHGQLQAKFVVVHLPNQRLHMFALLRFVVHRLVHLLHQPKSPLAQFCT